MLSHEEGPGHLGRVSTEDSRGQEGQGGHKGWPWECPGLLPKMCHQFCLFTGETPMPP